MKRMLDVLVSMLLLLTAPLHLVLHRSPRQLLRNSWQVFRGQRTWVGYELPEKALPPIPPGILRTTGIKRMGLKADIFYARNYDWWQDLLTIARSYWRLA